MPNLPTAEKVLKALDDNNNQSRWTPEAAQAAGLLHIADALQEKNRIDLMRLKLDIINDRENFDRAFRSKMTTDITDELWK